MAAVLMTAFLLAAAAFVSAPSASAAEPDNHFYVNSGNTPQWTGKIKIYNDPQAAIWDASAWSTQNGDAQAYVLVAFGVYNAPAFSFQMLDGVTIIGGFAGTEDGTTPTYIQDGDPLNANNTVFSGNDAVRVFYNNGLGATAVLQNAVITGGSEDEGAGMYNNGSSPTITDCAFTGNKATGGTAQGGGAMYNNSSSPTITNCTFKSNTAVVGGAYAGGMFNNGGSPTITECAFIDNKASNSGSGGAMYNNGSSPTITNCTFTGNETNRGGAVSNTINSNPIIADCTFTGNITNGLGGAMYNGGNPTITNCTFEDNEAFRGGAMCNYASSPIITSCTFLNNTVTGDGGALFNTQGGSPTITNCTFTGNEADGPGGGISNSGSSPAISSSIFMNNKATNGGAIYNDVNGFSGPSNPTVTNCTFIKNTATGSGGGMYSDIGSAPALFNCILVLNNSAGSKDIDIGGGAIYSCIIGSTAYNSTGATTPVTPAPAASNFDADGSLRYTATYAIGKGDYNLYVQAIAPVIVIINGAYGTAFTPDNMCDINGNHVAYPSTKIDIGAFRYIDAGQNNGAKDYYVSASANGGASISPEGKITVGGGTNVTFNFSASSVTVDGAPLSAADVEKGYYTFQNVLSNHTISATGAPAIVPPVNLTITQKGSGYAEYSVNGSPFTKYTGTVSIQDGSSVVLRAVAGDGNEFKEWKDGNATYTSAEISFSNVKAHLNLDLSFTGDDDNGIQLWMIGAIALLVILLILIAVRLLGKKKV